MIKNLRVYMGSGTDTWTRDSDCMLEIGCSVFKDELIVVSDNCTLCESVLTEGTY